MSAIYVGETDLLSSRPHHFVKHQGAIRATKVGWLHTNGQICGNKYEERYIGASV